MGIPAILGIIGVAVTYAVRRLAVQTGCRRIVVPFQHDMTGLAQNRPLAAPPLGGAAPAGGCVPRRGRSA